MRGSWRLAYAYAKASGALSKGFLREGARSLAQARDPRALTRLIYPGPVPDATESVLIRDAEAGLNARMRARTGKVLALMGRGSWRVIRAAFLPDEAERAKAFLRSALRGEKRPDIPTDDPGAVMLDEAAYPDVERMFSGSAFPWVAESARTAWTHLEENRMDREVRASAWRLLRGVPGRDGTLLRSLFAKETRLRNAVWALRLAFNFKMKPAEIEPLLVALPGLDLVSDALEAASFQPDARTAFQAWKLSKIADADSEAEFWRIDPAAAEIRAEELIRTAFMSVFRSSGPSDAALYCYLRLSSIECDVIRSAYESLRIGPEPFVDRAGKAFA